jgi:hypothetical protein
VIKDWVNYAVNKYKYEVLMIGDCDVKRCATELRQILDHKYSVMGISKPGANAGNILETATQKLTSCSSKDF